MRLHSSERAWWYVVSLVGMMAVGGACGNEDAEPRQDAAVMDAAALDAAALDAAALDAAGGSDGAATGGRAATGGSSGGMNGLGGRSSTGGAPATGGTAAGGAATGGSAGTSGAAAVRWEARTDESDPARPSFSWSGSALVARFQGTDATLRIDGSPNQFQIVVDGVATRVLKVVSGTTQYAVATGLTATVHDLQVWRRTEGNLGKNRFLALDIAGGSLQPAPAVSSRRLEIYGDSITAGYGLEGKGPNCTRSSDNDNHYLTYGAVTARALSLEIRSIAWSGIGMYRNYGITAASADAMPAVYARTIADDASKTWDFARWQPHAVVINLGTNDFSTKGDPGMPFRDAYLAFVRDLRRHYANAFFILAIGPMLDGNNLTAVRAHLKAIVQARAGEGDDKVSFLEFPTQVQADGYGCDSHPSATTNGKMAALLTAELKARLSW